jgi:hypothetical protein
VLISFGAVAVAAGIIALEPAFATGAALGVALVAIGLAISFFAAEQWGLLGTATTIIGALLLAGGVIGFAEADFAGLVFSALLFLALAVAIRSNFLMALVPLALAGALGSSTGYQHAVYMLTVNEPSITIVFFALLAGAAYLISQHVGQVYQQLAITFARVSLILVNFGFWIGSLWGDYPGETWAQGQDYRLWSNKEAWRAAHLHVPETAFIVGWAILIMAVWGLGGAHQPSLGRHHCGSLRRNRVLHTVVRAARCRALGNYYCRSHRRRLRHRVVAVQSHNRSPRCGHCLSKSQIQHAAHFSWAFSLPVRKPVSSAPAALAIPWRIKAD